MRGPVDAARDRTLRRLDERLGYADMARTALGKVFPDHWSFMLGEIALYCFVVLVATGTFLAIFFDPSSSLKVYDGSYQPLHGEDVSSAFASTVQLSWDVRGGLLMRQVHHWAALIFIAAITLHLCRIFFTGMFRKPRELNWTVGLTLFVAAIFTSFAGYSLPDDLLSGTGLHIFYSTLEAVPFVGGWLAYLVFGAGFPGPYIIGRLYILHVFVVPVAIAGLIGIHLAVLIRQKHSHFAGPGHRDSNVVGSRMWPSYALRSLSLFSVVAAVCFLMGGLVQINPVWVWGEFKSSTIMSPSVADWYIAWVEGALRMFPPVELHFWGFTIPDQFWPAVLLPGLTFAVLYLWPFIDRRLTGDRGTHHIAAGPMSSPRRFAIGVWAIGFYSILLLAAGEELIVQLSGATIETVRDTLRVCVLVLPVVAALLAHRAASNHVRREAAEQQEESDETERELTESPLWIRWGPQDEDEEHDEDDVGDAESQQDEEPSTDQSVRG
ncbi:cytochrome bc1 complex cytochrome b subunit [Nocardioides terrisoli]|uniref:cytochrome bc1 complex cytochrome b subunit n=1 Tax=Nocardioides terrisoli TaxID=3388267 RepID=UPI00287B60C0|nr:ubiquinol-cytochrome c reductase cytochrome b subunit [Nocardioides marmorisolisilvae]